MFCHFRALFAFACFVLLFIVFNPSAIVCLRVLFVFLVCFACVDGFVLVCFCVLVLIILFV